MKFWSVVPLALLLVACSQAPAPVAETHGVGNVVRLDPAFDALMPRDAQIEKVAGGFQFTEGPLWRTGGRLWFSDVVGNVVRSVTPSGQVEVLIRNSGGASTAPAGSFIGSNGMVAGKDGTVELKVPHGATAAIETNLLEHPEGDALTIDNDRIHVAVHPFEILAVRVNYPHQKQ